MSAKNLDIQYMRMAQIWAENSHATLAKVGCLIVKNRQIISDGYNGSPNGFDNICEDENGDTKPEVLHAELNAICKLAKSNNSGENATLYVTLAPCLNCAKLIIQTGISKVFFLDKWKSDDGLDLLKKAKIEVFQLKM